MEYGATDSKAAYDNDSRLSQAIPKAVPAMEVALKALAERISRLEQCAANLEARFSSVLRTEPPSNVQTSEGRKLARFSATSQVGSAIEQCSMAIENVSDRLALLSVRCEL